MDCVTLSNHSGQQERTVPPICAADEFLAMISSGEQIRSFWRIVDSLSCR